jgi:hypothetical protein
MMAGDAHYAIGPACLNLNLSGSGPGGRPWRRSDLVDGGFVAGGERLVVAGAAVVAGDPRPGPARPPALA